MPQSVTAAPNDITHLTGVFPPTSPVEGLGILQATGVFEGAVGTVRLSGAVNLAIANQITASLSSMLKLQVISTLNISSSSRAQWH